MYDLIIIGSGPAGLSAAVYGRRAGLELLVIEGQPMSGGQVLNTYEVDNYLGMPGMNGFDMGMKFKEHADMAGAEYKTATVIGIEAEGETKTVQTTDGTVYEAKALILATGAQHALLGVSGENEYKGKGVSYCATCDGAFFKGRDVAVVGGGDVAVEDAVYLSRICRKVYLIHRRDKLRAARALQEKLMKCENVEILWNRTVDQIYGSDVVEGVKLQRVPEKTVTKQPGTESVLTGQSGTELIAAEQSAEALAVDGVFIAVGMHPNTEAFQKNVPCDKQGYVIAGEDCVTKVPGVFAAGDIRTKQVRQIITAVADGACAIGSVEKYLNEK
ncbi:MAG: FAD-dependent oxidoreductase [Lachnospiraceae bacterium]|nr:FAD-dependent oxidoreductase [Lachnospiraceae bacterium]